MKPLTLSEIEHNAYRTLGLTAGATQEQVDAAARAMRLWEDPAHIPPTANDAAFMGPLQRGRPSLESAVSRLADPETRVEERLWWFCKTPPPNGGTMPSTPDVLVTHDSLLVYAGRLLRMKANPSTLQIWRATIDGLRALAKSPEYRAWLLAAETGGDFEKRASEGEVVEAQKQLAERFAWTLAGAVEATLHADKPQLKDSWAWRKPQTAAYAARVVRMLRASAASAPAGSGGGCAVRAADPAERVLDGLEDLMHRRCDNGEESVRIAWKTRKIDVLKPACKQAVDEFQSTIRPIAADLTDLAGPDDDRRDRVRQRVAGLLSYLSEGYDACYDFSASESVLRLAAPYAARTMLEPAVEDRLHKTVRAAAAQKLNPRPRAGAGRRKKVGVGVIVFSIAMVLRFLVPALNSQPNLSGDDIPRHTGYSDGFDPATLRKSLDAITESARLNKAQSNANRNHDLIFGAPPADDHVADEITRLQSQRNTQSPVVPHIDLTPQLTLPPPPSPGVDTRRQPLVPLTPMGGNPSSSGAGGGTGPSGHH